MPARAQAAATAGLETVCSELSPQALGDEFFGGVDARARTWLDANPRSPSFGVPVRCALRPPQDH